MSIIIETEDREITISPNEKQRKRMAFQLINGLDIIIDLKSNQISTGGLK